MRLMPSPWFVVVALVMLIGGAGAGFVGGLVWEANSRDAQAYHDSKDSLQSFLRGLERGKSNVRELIEWRQRARIYYRNWQKELSNVPDTQLAECTLSAPIPETKRIYVETHAQHSERPGSVVLLSADFVRLYNNAWLPAGLDAGDPGRAAGEAVEAGGVTPREVLANTQLNAELCGEDRKRLDKLIDQIQGEMKGRHASAD